jgi:hypothetical protein
MDNKNWLSSRTTLNCAVYDEVLCGTSVVMISFFWCQRIDVVVCVYVSFLFVKYCTFGISVFVFRDFSIHIQCSKHIFPK